MENGMEMRNKNNGADFTIIGTFTADGGAIGLGNPIGFGVGAIVGGVIVIIKHLRENKNQDN